ncbi:DUF421 domain-containing protein [Rummeliibacillus stabekisii]|uniref:DUF421 domain-containing protein n=1 Tax=Rummeliibacillus TaxID=648802 RepID=UPI0012384BBE|nr:MULTISPECIES: DUF421 domain-containing protein [Rummeliibacillus]MCM3316841.1 DUF421 domain-containing protein [Rummeliibacillus stabekisii]
MNDLMVVSFRMFLLYFILIIIIKLMGKREVGELSMIDLVVFILLTEVAAFAVEDKKRNFFESLLPMIVLLVLQVVISFISLKFKNVRDIIDGDPTLIIRDGVLQEKEMKKQRYNLDDLFQQLREQQIGSIQSVAYAFLESSGNLAVFKKGEMHPILPLIVDGEIQTKHLILIQKDKSWLIKKLEEAGYKNPKDIFYCCFEDDSLHVQLKS